MKQFETGHRYGANDPGLGGVLVLKRTAQFIKVRNVYGLEWRMKIRRGNGTEYAYDSAAGGYWAEAFMYRADLEEGVDIDAV